MRLYLVYCISVGSSTCFGCWNSPSGARTTVITASGTGQPGLLPSALVVELELNQSLELELNQFQLELTPLCRYPYAD